MIRDIGGKINKNIIAMIIDNVDNLFQFMIMAIIAQILITLTSVIRMIYIIHNAMSLSFGSL